MLELCDELKSADLKAQANTIPNILLHYNVSNQVLVTVLDINDYRPRFSERVYNTSVFENEPSGTSVITIKATDLDEGENAAVLYNMLGPHSGMKMQ